MKLRLLSVPLLLLSATVISGAAPDKSAEHTEVLKVLKADISARPSRVLVAVEDALTMDEPAACEIVKSAITLTKADNRLVGEIVYTALKHSPGMSAVIVECAVDTAPGAAAEIKKAMQRALGETAGGEDVSEDLTEGSGEAPAAKDGKETAATGKETTGKGKVPVAPEPPVKEEDWWGFGSFGHGIGGIYLTPPGNGLSNGRFIPPVVPRAAQP
jgi:hypothetical protein